MYSTISIAGNVFTYRLSVKDPQYCAAVTYRAGDCCNGTLDTMSFALQSGMTTNDIASTHLFNSFGQKVRVRQSVTGNNLLISPENSLYVDGDSTYTLQITFKLTSWTNTAKFPCPPSQFDTQVPACDVSLEGFQTQVGQPRVLELESQGNPLPGCCPEGLVFYPLAAGRRMMESSSEQCQKYSEEGTCLAVTLSKAPSVGSGTMYTFTVIRRSGSDCPHIDSIQLVLAPGSTPVAQQYLQLLDDGSLEDDIVTWPLTAKSQTLLNVAVKGDVGLANLCANVPGLTLQNSCVFQVKTGDNCWQGAVVLTGEGNQESDM